MGDDAAAAADVTVDGEATIDPPEAAAAVVVEEVEEEAAAVVEEQQEEADADVAVESEDSTAAIKNMVEASGSRTAAVIDRIKHLSQNDAKKIAAATIGVWGTATGVGWAMQQRII